ncbi:MAG: putative lipoprotein [Proteobacteria bacterium]|nr:putative lipoprotein [Pseudomonadota bacterium]
MARRKPIGRLAALLALALLAGCATTRVETTGMRPAAPLCQAGQASLPTVVYWGPQWRPDQKEPALREAAALRGIEDFLSHTSCLGTTAIHRLPSDTPPPGDAELIRLARNTPPVPARLLLIVVRELGPRLSIGLPVIVEGGTEVLLDVRVLNPQSGESLADARTLWRNGGIFVIKGVGTLDRDLSEALRTLLLSGKAAD